MGCSLVLASVVPVGVFLSTALVSPSAQAQAETTAPGAAQQPGADAAPSAGTETPAEAKKAGPVVVPPEVVEYSSPVYPPDAYAQGIEATVRLTLVIDVDGTVSDPQVVEPVGNGFDEAALAAALGLRFTPVTVDGVPRKVKWRFDYPFAIEDAEPAAAEAPEAEPEAAPVADDSLPGDLLGTIYISGTETPLPGVAITITDALGAEYQLTTDAEGRFSFDGMPAGDYTVRIAAEGFETIESTENIAGNLATDIVYRIAPEKAPGEVEVVIRGERPPREVTRRTLERREVNRIPGSSGDALRSIQSLPGVARPPGLAGLLIVRGSAPQDTATFVDGTNVPLIYHFGGLSSVVPTEMLERIDFYPGNFSVRYGRQQGGIVDVGLRAPNTDCYDDFGELSGETGCFHGMAQLDNINGRVMLSGPIAKDWSFTIAGRRSWIETWLKPVLEEAGSSVTNAPVYYDYQAVVERNRGPGDRLSLRFYGSDDRFATIITDPAASDPALGGSLSFGTAFVRGQALYQKDLTDDVSIDTSLSVGKDVIDFQLGTNKLVIDTIPVYLRSEMGFKVHETTRVNVGFDFLAAPYDVLVRFPPPPRPGEASSGPLATAVQQQSDTSGFSFRPGWYSDIEWQPNKRWRVVPGVRIDSSFDTQNPDFSPRLNLRYNLFLPEDRAFFGQDRKTVLKGGIGKYSQQPQFQETDEVFGTPGLESNASWHYALGVEQGLTDQVELSLEGFYKDLEHQVARNPGPDGAYIYDNQGSGSVIGLETLLRYNPDERFFGWVAYTISKSVRKDCPTCEERYFEYDQTHNLILLGSYRLGRGWEVGARFRIVSGPLDTPVQQPPMLPAIYSGDGGTYVSLPGEPYSERLPLFHQADFRVDKRWTFRTWRLSTYIDVQNVYNNMAVEGVSYNYNYSQQSYLTGLPILPSLGVRGEF